jgi:isoleucyl-tRNA synthetase
MYYQKQMVLHQLNNDSTYKDHEDFISKMWAIEDTYRKLNKAMEGKKIFRFVDGPPFCSSKTLHKGHILVGYAKSSVLFYMMMNGFLPLNRLGFDVHGLPIEAVICKQLNLETREDIIAYGIDKFNHACKQFVYECADSWDKIYGKIGRWADFNNIYKTMDPQFMESCLWVFKQLWNKGLIYKGFRVMHYSYACATTWSNAEASQNYKDIITKTAYVFFPLKDNPKIGFVAWTTTPFTLPSNVALCLNPETDYVKVYDRVNDRFYIVAENCVKNLELKESDVPITFYGKGKDLVGIKYEPLFDNLLNIYSNHHTICDNYVSTNNTIGTGIVHEAPSYGDDDFRICLEKNIITHEQVGQLCPIDDNGKFTSVMHQYVGQLVFDANTPIIIDLKKQGKLIRTQMYEHSYAHCWRTDTPLINRAVSSYFIKVTAFKDRMIELNKSINWTPESIGQGRFGQWLNGAKDWGISRSRFFGLPIPLWVSDDGEETVCVGSVDELVELANLSELERPVDLHREFVDHIQIPSKMGKGMLKRVHDVMDCWFESGCVPIAQIHYPFENKELLDDPNMECTADFICEGQDQCRGWFYTLMAISTAIFDKPAFKNVICTGLILAPDGQKESKRLNNFTDPNVLLEKYGADFIRLYMLNSPAVSAGSLCFNEQHMERVKQRIIPYINGVKFFLEHTINYQKKGHKFTINEYIESTNVMDKWIVSSVGTLLQKVTDYMNRYELNSTVSVLIEFIEDLANWYIKFNRDRLKGHSGLTEWSKSLSTLYHVLYNYNLMLAPFAPFLTEYINLELEKLQERDKEISIFAHAYPTIELFPSYYEVERQMKRLQTVSFIVRRLRQQNPKFSSVKVPIKKVIIAHSDPEFINDVKAIDEIIQDEINCLEFSYHDLDPKYIDYTIQPNIKAIGLKFKNDKNIIMANIVNISKQEIELFAENEENVIVITLNNNFFELTHQDLKVIKNVKLPNESNNSISETNDGLMVAIDCTFDEEIINLHLIRMFIVQVQKLRKYTELRPWDKIKVFYDCDTMNALLETHHDSIISRLKCELGHMSNRSKYHEPDYAHHNIDFNSDKMSLTIIKLEEQTQEQKSNC